MFRKFYGELIPRILPPLGELSLQIECIYNRFIECEWWNFCWRCSAMQHDRPNRATLHWELSQLLDREETEVDCDNCWIGQSNSRKRFINFIYSPPPILCQTILSVKWRRERREMTSGWKSTVNCSVVSEKLHPVDHLISIFYYPPFSFLRRHLIISTTWVNQSNEWAAVLTGK